MCGRCEGLERDNRELQDKVRRLERRLRLARRITDYGIWKVSQVVEVAEERIGQPSGVPPLVWQRGKGWHEAAGVGLEHLANVKAALGG